MRRKKAKGKRKKRLAAIVASFLPSSFLLLPFSFYLHPFPVGPEGVEPTPCGLKVRRAACYNTTLYWGAAFTFPAIYCQHGPFLPFSFSLLTSSFPVVVLRIERSVIRLSAEFRPPAFDYQSSRAPRSRTESLLLPKQACYPLHLCPNEERTKEEG